MRHGTENELNAVATAGGKAFPAWFSHRVFSETGCLIEDVPTDNGPMRIVTSPDGEGIDSDGKVKLMVEVHVLLKPDHFTPQCTVGYH